MAKSVYYAPLEGAGLYERVREEALIACNGDTEKAEVLISTFNEALASILTEQSEPGVESAPRDRAASLLQSVMLEKLSEEDREPLTTEFAHTEAIPYDDGDLLNWIGTFFHNLFNPDLPFIPPTTETISIPDNAEIALISDFGTGMYGATQIKNSLENSGIKIFIHLGDIYYSGFPKEVESKFLPYWPKLKDPDAKHFALNANHEMFSGGRGYFNAVLPAFKQRSSCFALTNAYHLIIGFDSAYDDHKMKQGQDRWIRDLINLHPTKKIILLSHHQPFSAFESQGPGLVAPISDLLNNRRIRAWYWGHEHRCLIYDGHPSWALLGRCIGHGAMPYKRKKNLPLEQIPGGTGLATWQRITKTPGVIPSGYQLDGPNAHIDDQSYGANGYMTLKLSRTDTIESIHDVEGRVLYSFQY